ncbi:MAG TPA: hypothetical protein VFK06_17920 [Candidatus Angelobacter sp.]|nr:hypothetical protein [Candidatus Angelobacter sp.]
MKTFDAQQIDPFWKWFGRSSDKLIRGVQKERLTTQLDRRLRRIHPGLIWEIRPGASRPRQLTISPNLDPNLRGIVQEIIFAAPPLKHWDLSAVRQAKDWNYRLLVRKFGAGHLEIDVSKWSFVLLCCSSGKHQVLLSGENVSPLAKKQRWKAAGDALVNILGEEMVLDAMDGFELVRRMPSMIATRSKPISLLRETIMVPAAGNCLESGVQCV